MEQARTDKEHIPQPDRIRESTRYPCAQGKKNGRDIRQHDSKHRHERTQHIQKPETILHHLHALRFPLSNCNLQVFQPSNLLLSFLTDTIVWLHWNPHSINLSTISIPGPTSAFLSLLIQIKFYGPSLWFPYTYCNFFALSPSIHRHNTPITSVNTIIHFLQYLHSSVDFYHIWIQIVIKQMHDGQSQMDTKIILSFYVRWSLSLPKKLISHLFLIALLRNISLFFSPVLLKIFS